ncbi:MAG: DUF5685 family protein [Lachnospiraceae bacterium]
MFGYIVVNQSELKFREFDEYRSYYCGLCDVLKQKYGKSGQLTLTYDMTFVVMLLSGLYEPETAEEEIRCVVHPFQKHLTKRNLFTQYAADMNIVLSYYKCLDDWQDDRKVFKLLYSKFLCRKFFKIKRVYKEKVETIGRLLRQLSEKEKEDVRDIDYMSGVFGEIMAEILVYKEDEWKDYLYNMGFYLGKFIYLMDAYEDVEEDEKSGNFNPLRSLFQKPDFEESVETILTLMMAECSKNFEQLPIIDNISILRNILYSGVWHRYGKVKQKRAAGQNEPKEELSNE